MKDNKKQTPAPKVSSERESEASKLQSRITVKILQEKSLPKAFPKKLTQHLSLTKILTIMKTKNTNQQTEYADKHDMSMTDNEVIIDNEEYA